MIVLKIGKIEKIKNKIKFQSAGMILYTEGGAGDLSFVKEPETIIKITM